MFLRGIVLLGPAVKVMGGMAHWMTDGVVSYSRHIKPADWFTPCQLMVSPFICHFILFCWNNLQSSNATVANVCFTLLGIRVLLLYVSFCRSLNYKIGFRITVLCLHKKGIAILHKHKL